MTYDAVEASPQAVKKREASRGLTRADIFLSAFLLQVVVLFGILRFHFQSCSEEAGLKEPRACLHPIMTAILGAQPGPWLLQHPRSALAIKLCTWLCPLCMSLVVTAHCGATVNRAGGWLARDVLSYQVTSAAVGCVASLTGVGGGLILAPFFLLSGMDPSVAVGTSSSCVLFISTSSTLQYVFTDRVIMSLALVYGVTNLAAFYAGTSMVHYMQDKFAGRSSYITMIVAAGIGLSAVLSCVKLCSMVFKPAQAV